ncbi:E3 ubiquitin-protein ligase RNF4 isoform 1-T2 [Discoglossus pictus]
MSTAQRKRKEAASRNSRQTQKRRRVAGSTTTMAAEAETIELESGEEVVDLTCESSEPVVVDLTHNDSVVVNTDSRRSRSSRQTTSCVLSSDDEDSQGADVFVTSKGARDLSSLEHTSRPTSGTVSCPICMDGYSEIIQSGRLIVSTRCGHIFCSQCLRDALKNVTSCPTCRKKLTAKQYHPIYV